ncbi:MAG: hypothetical protein ABI771_14960 [Betaproteobacteria bacterium]
MTPEFTNPPIVATFAATDRLSRLMLWAFSLMLAGVTGFVLTVSAFSEELRATRLGVALAGLLALHFLKFRKFVWFREFGFYLAFFIYMLVSLLWTRDVELASNTLVPALDCILVFLLFGSLMAFHSIPVILIGNLLGFFAGIALYTRTQGFPFSYPDDFSYNAIAGMYLFGLFLTIVYGCFKRLQLVVVPVALVLMLHIVATTSIKTNLGIVLGAFGAALFYSKQAGALLRRNLLMIVLLGFGLVYVVTSNESIGEAIERGTDRVSLGVEVLQARDDLPGYSAFQERDQWRSQGIEGWLQNPLFGHGVEGFRDRFGITSHSTPVDVLYNSGLIGIVLFYLVFVSLLWRIATLRRWGSNSLAAIVFGATICYAFMSLSGVLHYNVFFAAFVTIACTLLSRLETSFPNRTSV